VEEGRVVHPEPCSEDRVVLVARRADGVEAPVRLLQLAGGHVDLAREELVLEDAHCRRGSQRRATDEWGARRQAIRGGFGE